MFMRAVILDVVLRTNARMNCPRCEGDLEERSSGADVVHGCAACGGVWLDREQTSRVFEHLAGAHDLVRVSTEIASDAPMLASTRAVPLCPIDREPLDLCEAEGIQIDVCETHGTWFDGYELERIVKKSATTSSTASRDIGIFDLLFGAVDALNESKRRGA